MGFGRGQRGPARYLNTDLHFAGGAMDIVDNDNSFLFFVETLTSAVSVQYCMLQNLKWEMSRDKFQVLSQKYWKSSK
jgi:hypothetical protein